MNRIGLFLLGLVALGGGLALWAGAGWRVQAAPAHMLYQDDRPGQVLTTPTPPWSPTPLPTVAPTPCPLLEDMPPGYPDADSALCVVCQGIMNVYPCGGPGEPC